MPHSFVTYRRATAATVLAFSLVLPFAAVENGFTAHAAEATSAGTIEFADPTLSSAPRIDLTGTLLVVPGEPAATDVGETVETVAPALYAVEVANGALVPVSGEFPETVRSGDTFSGTVAVSAETLSELPAETATEVEATEDAPSLGESTPAAQEVIASVIADETTMEVASARVDTEVAPAVVGGAAHELTVVVVNPAGTAAVTNSDSDVTAISSAATSFWASSSLGAISSFTQSGSVTRISSSATCAQDPFARWAEVLDSLGLDAAHFLDGSGRHLAVLLPAGCNSAQGPGVGTVGASLHEGGLSQITVGLGVNKQTLIHELGHNMSLTHSNIDVCGADAVSLGCSEYEYGDAYDVMGVGMRNFDSPLALNSRNQVQLGFVAAGSVSRFALASTETTRSFSVSVGTLVGTSASRYVAVVDPDTGKTLYVDYRRGDSGAFYAQNPTLTFGSTQVKLAAGVRLLRDSSTNGTTLITSAPTTDGAATPSSSGVGQSIGNPSGTVRVTVNTLSASAAGITITLTRTPAAPSQPVYRFWSAANSTHFYTSSVSERDQIIRNYPTYIWQYEGERYRAFTTPVAGTVPLYRFWSPTLQGHFFTASEAEKNHVVAAYDDSIWTFEGVAYYVYPLDASVPSTKVVSRFWSPDNSHHFYTADAGERKTVINNYTDNVWTYEGARFRVPLK